MNLKIVILQKPFSAFLMVLVLSIFTGTSCTDDPPPANVPPILNIGGVKDIKSTTAVAFGNVNIHHDISTYDYIGFCYTQEHNTPAYNDYRVENELPGGPSNFNVEAKLLYLKPETKTYVRIFYEKEGSIAYSDIISFITEKETEKPVVLTDTATQIDTSSAVLFGYIKTENLAPVTERGVIISLYNHSDFFRDFRQISSTNTGNSFVSDVDSLLPNHSYYYRAYAKNSYGISYGDERTFKTTKSSQSNLSRGYGVILGGNLTTYSHLFSFAKNGVIDNDSGNSKSSIIDFLFEDHSDFGAVIWGPTDPEVQWSYSEITGWPVRNTTLFYKTGYTKTQFESANSNILMKNVISSITATKIQNISVDDIIAIKTSSGKLALIMITEKTRTSGAGSTVIKFDYLIEK